MTAQISDRTAFETATSAAGENFGVPRAKFIEAMGRTVTSVTVVTTVGAGGRCGLTVSAVASVSADPPMIMVCINRRSPVAAAIQTNGVFCVNLLAAHHAPLSDTFAGRPRAGEPFDFGTAEWQATRTGSARLPDAAASFDCVLDAAHDAGTHTMFIGKVVDALAGDGDALAYCRRSYCTAQTQPIG
jgi:flavin reductase (DIM6/NTAB) family NADH-FMN oxidoreductase RutF